MAPFHNNIINQPAKFLNDDQQRMVIRKAMTLDKVDRKKSD